MSESEVVSTETPRFSVNVTALLEAEGNVFESALTEALKAHGVRGGDLTGDADNTKFIVVACGDDGTKIGTSDPFSLDLREYQLKTPATLTLVRDGKDPVTHELTENATLEEILEELDITLEEGERVFDNNDRGLELDEEIDPDDGHQTLTIKVSDPTD